MSKATIKKERNKRVADDNDDSQSENETCTKAINKKLKQTTLDFFGYKNKTNETATATIKTKSDNNHNHHHHHHQQQQVNKESKQIKKEESIKEEPNEQDKEHYKERTVSVSSTTSASSSPPSSPSSPKRSSSSKPATKKPSSASSANRSFNDSSYRYQGGGGAGGGAPAFLSLESSMKDPKLKVYLDDQFVCIIDKYNKSKEHYLLIPIKPKFHQLNEIDKSNLDLLKDMKKVTIDLINNKFKQKDIDKYKIGFHSVQSMSPLHMHICTNDFVSDCLKTKKHWNSFNTQYFIDLDTIIDHLNNSDDLSDLIEPKNKLEEYLKTNLKCNQCKQSLSNMPKLKDHLLAHYNKTIKNVD